MTVGLGILVEEVVKLVVDEMVLVVTTVCVRDGVVTVGVKD